MTVFILFCAFIAVVSAIIAAWGAGRIHLERHDTHNQLQTLASRVDSLQGSLGNLKQSVRRDVKKILLEEIDELEVSEPSGGGGDGMNDMMQALMMQSLTGGMQQGNAEPPANPARSGGIAGKGGSQQNDGDA